MKKYQITVIMKSCSMYNESHSFVSSSAANNFALGVAAGMSQSESTTFSVIEVSEIKDKKVLEIGQ
jgi:hypothetical protein